MPDIADAALSGDLWLDRNSQCVGEEPGHFLDSDRLAAADVEGTPDRSLDLQCQAASLGDVVGIDEITALLPVLENLAGGAH